MDHQYYAANVDISNEDIKNERENEICIEEKDGDAFLIDLYRERSFLYDKSHNDFKNKIIRDNAWNEISKIMQDKHGELNIIFYSIAFITYY